MVLTPPPLRAGSVVRVIAPSSPFDARLVWRGLGWLSERYRLRFERALFSKQGYLAGPDELRAAQLQGALSEPDVAAILCARGGYGATRYAHQIDFSPLLRAPRWLVGFSDITALHLELTALGVASLHACHVTALGRGDAVGRAQLVDALEHPQRAWSLSQLQSWVAGTATGALAGGNLTLMFTCAAAGRLRLPAGCVLLVEEVGERPYRIDRMLTALIVGGHLDGVAGFVVGELAECAAGLDGVTAAAVVRERLAALGVPLAAGLPVGHGRSNTPMVLGAEVRLEAGPQTARLVSAGG